MTAGGGDDRPTAVLDSGGAIAVEISGAPGGARYGQVTTISKGFFVGSSGLDMSMPVAVPVMV